MVGRGGSSAGSYLDAQWEGMGDVGSVRYEPALLPPCPTTQRKVIHENLLVTVA